MQPSGYDNLLQSTDVSVAWKSIYSTWDQRVSFYCPHKNLTAFVSLYMKNKFFNGWDCNLPWKLNAFKFTSWYIHMQQFHWRTKTRKIQDQVKRPRKIYNWEEINITSITALHWRWRLFLFWENARRLINQYRCGLMLLFNSASQSLKIPLFFPFKLVSEKFFFFFFLITASLRPRRTTR